MGLIDHRQTATYFLTIYALDYLSYLMVPMLKKKKMNALKIKGAKNKSNIFFGSCSKAFLTPSCIANLKIHEFMTERKKYLR